MELLNTCLYVSVPDHVHDNGGLLRHTRFNLADYVVLAHEMRGVPVIGTYHLCDDT